MFINQEQNSKNNADEEKIRLTNTKHPIFSYLGNGWSFPPAFIKNQGIVISDEDEDIKQSLQILFSTTPGERIFRFNYGCNIKQWVFDEINLSTKTLIIDTIKQAILYYEPRIDIEKIDVEIKNPLEEILWIHVDYIIRQTNSRSNIVYPFYFKEGSNL